MEGWPCAGYCSGFQTGVCLSFVYNNARKDEYVKELNHISETSNYDIVCLFVTNIITNGSYILYNEKARNVLSLAYDVANIEEGHFLENIVSRKKQMIAAILDVLESK